MESDEDNTKGATNTGQQPGQQSGTAPEGDKTSTGTQPGLPEQKTTPQKTVIPEGYISQEQLNSIITKRLEEDRKAQQKIADEEAQKKQGQFEPLYTTAKAEIETLRTETASQVKAAQTERDEIKTTLAGYVKADLLSLTPELLKLTPVDIGDKPEEFDTTKLSLTDLKTLSTWVAKAKASLKPEDGKADRSQRVGANRTGPVPAKTGGEEKSAEIAKAGQKKRIRLAF